MSITKKMAAIVSAAAVVASAFAAAPASAQSTGASVNSTIMKDVARKIDPTTHQVKFFAGERFNLGFNGSVKGEVLSSHLAAGDKVSFNSGITLVSGTVGASGYSNTMQNATVGGQSVMTNSTATVVNEKTYDTVPTGLSINMNYTYQATTDVVLTLNPVLTLGTYNAVQSDFFWGSSVARLNGSMPGAVSNGSYTATAEDANINLWSNTVCINTEGLAAGDVLEAQGTANGATANYDWSVLGSNNMSSDWGQGSTYTLGNLVAGSNVTFSANMNIEAPVSGTTYSLSGLKVVKQGSTTDLIKGCGTVAATGTLSFANSLVTVTLDTAADGMPGFDSYICTLYASTDSNYATPVAGGMGSKWGMGGPNAAPTCNMAGAPAGTYKVGLRGYAMGRLTEEKILDGTVTVTAAAAAKKAPKVPTVTAKVKIGKTFTVALHATKGSATKGANVDGLATTVTTTTKTICSVTAVKKAAKITGYTVKGLKAGACKVVLTITGDATYNALTKTVSVAVSK